MTRIYAVLLALALVLASCGTPEVTRFDWCYSYDFSESIDNINLLDGVWSEGQGILTDDTGLMRLNWEHSQAVQPTQIVVRVARGEPGSNRFVVTANALVFGTAASFTQSFPPELFNADFEGLIPIFASPANSQDYGATANISLEAAEPFRLHSVEIRGDGLNPFGVNTCGTLEGTITPLPTQDWNFPTPGETPTPTPTLTPTEEAPTITPSSTQSIQPTATCQAATTHSFWVGMNHPLSDPSTVPGNLTVIQGAFQPSPAGWFQGGFHAYPVNSYATLEIQWELPQITHISYINTRALACRDCGDPFSSTARLRMWGDGVQIFEGLPGRINTDSGYFGGNVTPGWYNTITIRVESWGRTWAGAWIGPTYLGSSCSNIATPTSTATIPPTATNTPTQTATFTRTPLPTVTLGSGTVTRTLIAVASPTLGATSTPITPTAAPPTLTPSPTRTLIPPPTAYQTITPWPTPEGTPPPLETPTPEEGEDDGENRILDAINSFGTWVQNGFNSILDLIGQGIQWAIGMANNIGTLIGNLIQAIVGLIENIFAFLGELWEIIKLLITIVVRLIQLFFAWIGEMTTRVNALLSAWWQAPLAPIPGLPMCTTNPTAHDLCAIYYILDYTIFAPGTPGELIIPLTLINLDIWMIVYFIRFVMKLVRRGERITNVG